MSSSRILRTGSNEYNQKRAAMDAGASHKILEGSKPSGSSVIEAAISEWALQIDPKVMFPGLF